MEFSLTITIWLQTFDHVFDIKTAIVGLWATAYDLIGISSPKTVVAGMSRVMYINVPVGEYICDALTLLRNFF